MFNSGATAVLTSTTGSQTVTVPSGFGAMKIWNGAANPVYLKWASSVAVPTSFASGEWVMCVAPGTVRVFDVPSGGGTLAYIASTAGGALVITAGSGDI